MIHKCLRNVCNQVWTWWHVSGKQSTKQVKSHMIDELMCHNWQIMQMELSDSAGMFHCALEDSECNTDQTTHSRWETILHETWGGRQICFMDNNVLTPEVIVTDLRQDQELAVSISCTRVNSQYWTVHQYSTNKCKAHVHQPQPNMNMHKASSLQLDKMVPCHRRCQRPLQKWDGSRNMLCVLWKMLCVGHHF